MLLAGLAISERKLKDAIVLNKLCLERIGKPVPSQVLEQISTELGQAGYLKKVIEVIEPHFSLLEHGPGVAGNLIKANVDGGNIDKAKEILAQIKSSKKIPEFGQILLFWSKRIYDLENKIQSA